MTRRGLWIAVTLMVLAMASVAVAWSRASHEESERSIKESEVPADALTALKKLAGGARLTEFSEETENGHTYYEGSWKGPNGDVDALVTPGGDLVELEEVVPFDSIPRAVQQKAHDAAGKDAKLFVEKKTYVMYEVKFRKGDRKHEVLYAPDGRTHEHEDEQGHEEGDDD